MNTADRSTQPTEQDLLTVPADRGPLTCERCGDPLPIDRRCDCAGDCDRDYVTAYRHLRRHAVIVRWAAGDEREVEEVWI